MNRGNVFSTGALLQAFSILSAMMNELAVKQNRPSLMTLCPSAQTSPQDEVLVLLDRLAK